MLWFQLSCCQTEDWSKEAFASCDLGDVRRSQRAAVVAQALSQQPGASIPDLFQSSYEVKAAYNLFDRPEATPDALQRPHRLRVAEAMAHCKQTILLLEDTSDLSWTNKKAIAGLGPIANGKPRQQGFQLHSALAVVWPAPLEPAQHRGAARRPALEILGLADQLYALRKPRPAGERPDDSLQRQNRPRESQIWSKMGQRLGPAPAAARWERVCDRAADIYEFLKECQELGHGHIVRAAQDRLLEDDHGRRGADSLFAAARQAKDLGRFELPLRARPGHSARVAQLAVSAIAVRIRSPQRPGAASGKLPGLPCTVVRIFEAQAAPGLKEPLEWILLYDRPVQTFEQAREIALKYSARWLIEEFHKALKTGLGAERLQLETAPRLFAAIAIMSIVALRLIDLRERTRVRPDAPAETAAISPLELQVLRAQMKRPIRTIEELALALGRLGGHMNRKADGMPGWQTLWRGMKKLQLLTQGALLAMNIQKLG